MDDRTIDQYLADISKTYEKLREDFNQLNKDIELSSEILKEKEAQLHAFLENTVDAVIIIDEEGIIQLFNATGERLFGYTKDEVIGQKVNCLMPEPHRTNHDKYIKNYVETGEKKIIGIGREEFAQRKNGELFPINLAVSETWMGNKRYFTGILRDLSNERKLEETKRSLQVELAESQKIELIGTLIAQFIHDIRSFITPIVGFSEILQDSIPKENAEAHTSITSILNATKHAEELATQLMNFVRKERADEQESRCAISATVKNTQDLIRASIPKTIDLHFTIEDFPDLIALQPIQMQQIIMNLCLNARDAIAEAGKITLQLVKKEGGAQLKIQDDGSGMNEETKSHILEPLYTTKARGKGTGLGLSVVNNFILQCKGSITISSKEGMGTTFTLFFPFAGEG